MRQTRCLQGHSIRLAVLPAAVASIMLAMLPGWTPVARAAAPPVGHDISWPNRPRGTGAIGPGEGNPAAPDSARFVIIGLTDRIGFTVTPC